VKCKSDLEKSAKIVKLRLQYEHELSTFCKQDQQDLVRYLQRQLISRDQRIAEQSYNIENLKNSSVPDSIDNNNNNNPNICKKTASIQILRSSDPDVITLTSDNKSADSGGGGELKSASRENTVNKSDTTSGNKPNLKNDEQDNSNSKFGDTKQDSSNGVVDRDSSRINTQDDDSRMFGNTKTDVLNSDKSSSKDEQCSCE
ncbi:unnamed protein product, partial [Rotaria magnacalcarata]